MYAPTLSFQQHKQYVEAVIAAGERVAERRTYLFQLRTSDHMFQLHYAIKTHPENEYYRTLPEIYHNLVQDVLNTTKKVAQYELESGILEKWIGALEGDPVPGYGACVHVSSSKTYKALVKAQQAATLAHDQWVRAHTCQHEESCLPKDAGKY